MGPLPMPKLDELSRLIGLLEFPGDLMCPNDVQITRAGCEDYGALGVGS